MQLAQMPKLFLVTPEELKSLQRTSIKSEQSDELGHYSSTHVISVQGIERKVRTKDPKIYIMIGLPRDAMASVMAHELGHAWLHENNSRKYSIEDDEGFAEWVAYKYLQTLALTSYMKTMTSRADVYGRGLNKVLKIEMVAGIRGVINYFFQR